MIREPRFLSSKRPYAVDLDGMSITTCEVRIVWHSVRVKAVWFRGRRDTPVACVGYVWGSLCDPKPANAVAALGRLDDGRYGGECLGRWDGQRYWGAQEPAEIERHLALLRPMLEKYPAVPVGFDGWWRYETSAEWQERNRPAYPTQIGEQL